MTDALVAPSFLAAGLLAPAWPLLIASLAVIFLRGRLQDAVFVAAPALALLLAFVIPAGAAASFSWLGASLTPVLVDGTSRLFGIAFAFAALSGSIFALGQKSTVERAAALLYAGAAEGVVFAGDLMTLFAFWEVMAIGSTLVIFAGGNVRAGFRYALMHVFGGVLLFAGITASVGAGGVALRPFAADGIGSWLMLAGILVNAGVVPVSAWVADAYPRASWSGAVFLSSFTTKAAVAVLIRLFPGEAALVPIGLLMAVYGLVYALLENDIRRILSYSIVGQVGFMVVAVGIGTPLALAAASAHALVHILYKGLLMMAAGGVLRATGTARLTALGGIARALPTLAAATLIGGLALAAMPLTAGFVSKSAIMAAIGKDHAAVAWFALTAISGGSFIYGVLRLCWFGFFRPRAPRIIATPPSFSMNLAMLLPAAALLAIGIFPNLLAVLVPGIAEVRVLTADHVLFQVQLFAGAAFCFVMLLRILVPRASITADADSVWRRAPAVLARSGYAMRDAARRAFRAVRAAAELENTSFTGTWHRIAADAGNWRTGDIALAATALLALCLLIAAF